MRAPRQADILEWLLKNLPASPRPGTSPQDGENILKRLFATQFQLVAFGEDEKPDVTIDISPGIWHEQPGNFRATYQTTVKGFSRVENLNTKKVN